MNKKRSNNKRLFVGGSLIAVLLSIFFAYQTGVIGGQKAVEVEIQPVSRANIIERVSASGAIQPEMEVKISPDVPGEIIELHVKEGDEVAMGKLLIKIRPDNYQSALARAEATLNQQKANMAEAQARVARAQAQVVQLKAEKERSERLYNDKVIAVADYEMALTNYQVAVQDLESAKQMVESAKFLILGAQATVSEAKENLRLTNVHAPMSGTVSRLMVEKGERVVGTSQMAGTEMLKIADLSKMEVRVDVNENDIVRLSLGDTAIIDVDAFAHKGKKFKGLVTSISNSAKEKTSAEAITEFEVNIKILNESYADLIREKSQKTPFRPGMTASVDIITHWKDNVLSVPLSAVTMREIPQENGGKLSKEVVFIFEEGIAKMVEVKTGISDFDNIEILEGLEDGVPIISGPYMILSRQLKDGDQVKVMHNGEK
jgi:HlyD family secretion protein